MHAQERANPLQLLDHSRCHRCLGRTYSRCPGMSYTFKSRRDFLTSFRLWCDTQDATKHSWETTSLTIVHLRCGAAGVRRRPRSAAKPAGLRSSVE